MKRIPNWDVALVEWALSVRGKPFRWGQTDCASLIRGAHRAMYGEDVFKHVPLYRGKAAALRTLSAHESVRAVLLGAGAQRHPVAFARSGDVLIRDEQDEYTHQSAMVVDGQAYTVEVGGVVTPYPVLAVTDGYVLRMPHGW